MNFVRKTLFQKVKVMVNRTLSARIFLSVRRKMHLTQKKMAERLHVHESTILRIEKGHAKPRAMLLSTLHFASII
jgi:DNA-binding XRE family transcriptional regulator